MKIQCQSCQAKYTIADEKVLGKVVKIRCKKCSATIVINGNESRPAEDAAETSVFDYAAGGSAEQWTVNVADGDQRTMTPQEIVAEYKAGVVNDETYCWKDGMADWLPLREVEQLYGAIKLGRGPQPSLHDDQSVPPMSSPAAAQAAASSLFSSNEISGAVDSPFAGTPVASPPPSHANGNGNALFGGGGLETHTQPAARRGGGRGQGQDLFGNVERAGGEDDVMTSAATGGLGAGASADDQKLTGQRNESSVLFSLSALTSDEKKAPAASGGKTENRTTASADGSGLIDIRALSAGMESEPGEKKKDTHARVDDIMNLSGGGAFGAALAAPILAPPPLEATSYGPDLSNPDAGKSNKGMLFAILGGAALIAVGIVVAVVVATKAPDKKDDPTTASNTASTATTGTAAATDTATAATAAPTTTTASNDPTPPTPGTGGTTGAKPAVVAAAGGGAKPAGGGHAPTGGGGGAEPAHTEKPAAAPAPAATDLGGAMAAAAGKPAEKPAAATGGSSAPFDRGAASAALGGINVQSCKKADGPTGSGHVKVTFDPSGSVSSAVVDSGPFPGTPVGGCIAGKFRGAHIPAFSGGPVSVGKSFSIN